MAYLVVVVSLRLPVVIPCLAPLVIKTILRQIEPWKSFLHINSGKVIIPKHSWLWRGIGIDPNEPRCVNMYMYSKEGVLRTLEPFDILAFGRFSQLAI